MLKTTSVADTATSNRLIRIWTTRYLPQLAAVGRVEGRFPASQLVETASSASRSKTTATVIRSLQLSCEIAGLETDSLYSYIPNIVNLAEARRLAKVVKRVYETALAVYEQQQPPSHFLKFIDSSSDLFCKLALPALVLPTITTLAEELEPVMLHLQEQHLASRDPRTIGFLTTQFHFSNKTILKQLSTYEQVLLTPYLKFVEEQICIPWKRVCAAAARHSPGSAAFQIVETMLPLSNEIADQVYQKSVQRFSKAQSRRGRLVQSGVATSTRRDLSMMQGYLWLCVLEEDMAAVNHELLPLCVMVFPSIGVQWSLVEQMLALLMAEIHACLKPDQQQWLLPYTQKMQAAFARSVPKVMSR